MLAASSLPVCQYVGMPGQNNPNSGGTNQGNSSLGSNNANNLSNTTSGTNSSTNNNGVSLGLVGGGGGGSSSAVAAKNQLEQLNTMREALFATDGWGCQHVNQETNWEVPSSPEPTNKDASGGPPIWKPNINNGTDLWESNLRNGGQPPAQSVQKTPWGHTPSSNLGGTWGEDDDGADSSSVWAGGSSSNTAVAASGVGVGAGVGPAGSSNSGGPNTGPQWGQSNVGVVAGSSGTGTGAVNMATGAVSSGGVNVPGGAVVGGGAAGNGWGDPRDLRSGPLGGPMDMRNVDPRDPMRAASAGDPRDLRMMDPRDPIRGDPRGISGRLNGNAELWGQHHPSMAHNQMQAINKMVGPGVGAAGSGVTSAVVGGGGVGGGIGPGGVNAVPGAGGNVGSQWGSPQTVVGPKDLASGSKQVSGWEEPSPPPQRRNIPNYDDGTSLWGGQQARVPGGGGGSAGGAHWKDISDPMARNHLMRGASAGVVGGQNVAPGGIAPANTSNPLTPQARLGGGAVGPGIGHKPDNSMWVHPNSGNRNAGGTWGDDAVHNVGVGVGSNWSDDKTNAIGGGNASGTWNDSAGSWNKAKIPGAGVGGGNWSAGGGTNVGGDGADIGSDWNTGAHAGIGIGPKPQQKINIGGIGGLNADLIKQSKQYRTLVELGFKKEEVERALIAANMNFEEATKMLRAANANIMMDSWRRHDDNLSSYGDHGAGAGGGSGNGGASNVFPGGRFPATGAQQTMSFPPNNLLNNMAAGVGANVNNPNLAALNSMPQALQVQKYLNQGGPHNLPGGPQSVAAAAAVAFGQNAAANVTAAATNAANNQPSAQQLRMLVQQIQMAVHSGYLSNQILNQPLAPNTLLLLNQLLSNIKHLQGAEQSIARGNNANNIQLNVQIAKYKQQIQNLQNQINTQQAVYVKQQQQQQQQQQHQAMQQQNPQQQQHPAHVGGANAADYLRHDAISALQGNFNEMNIKPTGYQSAPNQQSRLNQWKLPVLEKDLATDSTDFSRAPGATKQNANSMNSLGLQNDGTWSTGRNLGDGWPDSSNDSENKDWSVAQNSAAAAYTDLVQEFEPGKPWKGSQIKSIEDDPSITPGSVARSPLSINPTPKEADIFANASNTSPTDLPTLPLSSTTWSFNPNTSNQNFSSWSDTNQQELWTSSMNKTSRGPPPGLVGSNKNSGAVNAPAANSSNGWLGAGRVNVTSANAVGWNGGNNPNWNSNWLLLKNLTAQIDSATLRTLCMQHGPLTTFHLYLNQGIALCKYATREEANKAQMTLNNCPLGNTTICAETPSENEVQAILQHMPPPPGTPGGNGGSGNGAPGPGGNSGGQHNGSNNGSSGANGGQTGNGGSNNGGNGSSNSGNPNTGSGNSSSANSGWRQTTNQPNQQQPNQSRPSAGRETDFDYISKYVCSIVDD